MSRFRLNVDISTQLCARYLIHAYLQLCGLVDEGGWQVVLVLQQEAHLLHLLLQGLLHLTHSLERKHTCKY